MIKVGKVAMIKASDIEVSERARQELGDITELECSLKQSGLIQPLAVQKSGDKYILLAGERRFLLLCKNEVLEVPARIYDEELTSLQAKEIELAENFYRKGFEYWEEDSLIKEIDGLKKEQFGIKAPGPGSEGWNQTDTGNLLGITQPHVSNAIKRAEAREIFPELFEGCKTQKDATNVLKKMDEALIKEAIAEKLKATKGSNTIHQLSNYFVVKDFFAGVKEIPDGIMHLVEIDPPYAIDLNKAKKSEGESQYVQVDYNEIDSTDYEKFISAVFTECYRVMSDHSWLICWFGPEPWFETIYSSLCNAGFSTTRMCGIWTKSSGQSKRPELHLANSYEMFFYAWKGRPVLNKQGRRNIFDYPTVPSQQKTHPTERPIELMSEILDTFAMPGSRILVPFAGSGVTLLAAHRLGMSPVGFDLSKGYKDSYLVRANKMIS